MSKNIVLPKYLVELATPSEFPKRGDRNQTVRRLQEWLTLWGYVTSCDGDWGPATSEAVKKFKWEQVHLGGDRNKVTDVVDAVVWNVLLSKIMRATALPKLIEKDAFGQLVVAVAQQYLREGAREAGGDNRGPWQRHLSRGRENQPWCQDFASTVWLDAARALQMDKLAIPLCDDTGVASSYVPWVANEAKRAGKFMRAEDPGVIPPGSMFFLRSNGLWSHVGLVTRSLGDAIETIEGNTNDDGSANGYEVAARHRSRYTCDFGLI